MKDKTEIRILAAIIGVWWFVLHYTWHMKSNATNSVVTMYKIPHQLLYSSQSAVQRHLDVYYVRAEYAT